MGLLNDHRDKRAVRKLRVRARQYRELLELLPVGVIVHINGRIRYANTAATRMLGVISPRQLVGCRYADLVLSAAPSSALHAEQQTMRRLDGKLLDVEATIRASNVGKKRRTMVMLRETSHDSEVSITATERLRMVAESMTAVVTLDPVGDVVHWSAAAEQLTGYSAEQIVGRPLSVIKSEDDAARYDLEDILRRTVKSGRWNSEGWNRRRDGSMFYSAEVYTALFSGDGGLAGFSLSIRDLTQQPQGAKALRQTEEQLRQAQRMEAVGRLASGIAHDFNNLLTAIQGHAQFLSEDLTPGHTSRPDVEEILHSAERAAALTRQLLAFSRGQALQPETIQINTVVSAMERLLRRVISEDISLESVLDPELWTVSADASRVEQVLVNLIVNARDAMPRGGRITIRTANAELATSYAQRREEVEPGEYVMLAVSDNGLGMDRDTQARIFEPFFTTKDPDKGTGLGLSTVFGIVKQMSGHIYVYSEPDLGTTFKVYLPRAGALTPGTTVNAQAHDRSRQGEGVLIVEDDDSVRALARRVLESRGYKVWISNSAEEAADVLTSYGNEIALLVTDIVLPMTGGTALAAQARQDWPHLKILFMSGYSDGDVQRIGAVGDNEEFLEKPFTPEAFAHKVRMLLDASD